MPKSMLLCLVAIQTQGHQEKCKAIVKFFQRGVWYTLLTPVLKTVDSRP